LRVLWDEVGSLGIWAREWRHSCVNFCPATR
jgi:hypothetical protein